MTRTQSGDIDMKYLIFGNGWIGNMLKQYLGDKAILSEADINNVSEDIELGMERCNVWINTAAITDIDFAEKNKRKAFETNVLGAWGLAADAKLAGKKYVFFSSACVFESENMDDLKCESSEPNPKCFYSETKLMAERLILEENPDALVVRPRLPISSTPHPRNTLDKLSNYTKINDAQESITVIEDMMPVLIDLIEKEEKGIFHLVNARTMSPAEMADLMGHPYEKVSKESQNERLKGEGRAKRVTVVAGSERIPLLPDIWERAPEIIKAWREKKQTQNGEF